MSLAHVRPDRERTEDPTTALVRMVTDTPITAIPSAVLERSKRAILDTIAVSFAGSNWEVIPDIAALVLEWGGAPQSRVLVYGHRVPAPLAAFVNGPMARAIDMGDVHEIGGHISEWNVPTLFAAIGACAGPISGREFLAAYATSAELAARAGTSVNAMGHTTEGVMGEFPGMMCASASASRLLGLSADEAADALGICFSAHAMGEMSKYSEGTQMPRVQHGFSGDSAIKAAKLAQRGVTGPRNLFYGMPSGIHRILPWQGDLDPDVLTVGLGDQWIFAEKLSMKPYPSCKYTHSLITSTASIVRAHSIDPDEIESIDGVASVGARMTFEPADAKWNPRSVPEAMFSAPYTMATAALTGGFFLDDLEAAQMERVDKRALMSRVRMSYDETLDQTEGFHVKITLNDGRTFSHTEPFTHGHTQNPLDWDDLAARLHKCAAHAARPFSSAQLDRIVEVVRDLEEVEDMNTVLDLLVAE